MSEEQQMNESKAPRPDQDSIASFRKDRKLDLLAERFNVAQFVSYAPGKAEPVQQFCRLSDVAPNTRFDSVPLAIEALFSRSAEGTVNIRSFSEEQSQSREFLYGLTSVDDAVAVIRRISSEGAFTIANETIDVSDGGVSGVAVGGLVEFKPDSTPRGVESPGFASLPLAWATSVFQNVYGFDADLSASRASRIEFSLHPRRQGWRKSHVVYWEFGDAEDFDRTAQVSWPNDFSRLIGDKVYGLLIAHAAGLPVPTTTVIPRRVAPFTFGTDTGSSERWIRTSPVVQVPGKFTTAKGWIDPFRLVQAEDPEGALLASLLAQQAVDASFSGAAIEQSDGSLVVEGASGTGETFMVGSTAPEDLPAEVIASVTDVNRRLHAVLGSVRFEWAFDGSRTWVLQLHTGASQSLGYTLVPGEPSSWVRFDITRGLEALRQLVESLPSDTGIELDGLVGRSSHMADVVRKANVPTKIASGERSDL
ncbi:hypothetical protein [Neorhizobium sp. DAR64872/K0K18]|uniref:hypothetical protein n=1 Tax=Neorhizobium sp. DAR64872/K0K18 TaxID=3421958 RepID=UPI003D2D27C9